MTLLHQFLIYAMSDYFLKTIHESLRNLILWFLINMNAGLFTLKVLIRLALRVTVCYKKNGVQVS